MTELEQIMSQGADLIEKLLDENEGAMRDLAVLVTKGQDPSLVRIISPADIALLIRFQEPPK